MYSKDFKTLILIPAAKKGTYEVSENVTTIGPNAFDECSALTAIEISHDVTTIGESAFYGCTGLKTLSIPINVNSIGRGAFSNCSELRRLYVPAEWKGTDMLTNTSVPAGCKVVYGDVTEEVTETTPIAIPYAWLETDAGDILTFYGGNYEEAAMALATNGLPVWQCYVAGLSTTDKEAEFKVKSISFVDGEPVLEWSPDLDAARAYTVQGKAAMADPWGVPNASSRFFRVLVEMPE